MEHIWICEKISDQSFSDNIDYTEIYNGELNNKIKIFNKMQKRIQKRKDILVSLIQ